MATRRTLLSVTALSVAGLAGCLGDAISRSGGDENAVDPDRAGEILGRYDDAVETRNEGTTTRDTGIELFNDEQFSAAIDEFETARDRYETAADDLEHARDVAREIDHEEALSICENGLANTRLQIDATDAALDAATAAEDGEDAGTINDHVETYQDALEEAEATPFTDTDDLSEVLGF